MSNKRFVRFFIPPDASEEEIAAIIETLRDQTRTQPLGHDIRDGAAADRDHEPDEEATASGSV